MRALTRNDIFDLACFDNVSVGDDRTVWVQRCDRDLNPVGEWVKAGVVADGLTIEYARLEVEEAYSK